MVNKKKIFYLGERAMHFINNFKKGFTLAEILITVAIIGVVAVVSLTNLMQSYLL